jgi:hypothetical protein
MDLKNKILELFRTIDLMDSYKFVSFLTDDARFFFGNAPAVTGRENIKEAVSQFFKSVKSLSHKNLNLWINSDSVIYQGEVTYTRHDGSRLTLPFVNVFGMDGDKIKDYRIYIDINPLYA